MKEEFKIFEQYLADKGLKHSRQRDVILQYFLDTSGHMTVEDLYRSIHPEHPEIGRTTIYRTLKLLCDAKLADSIELRDGLTRFEHRYKHQHHDHMICQQCGTIIEFVSEDIERLQDEIAQAYGFRIESHRHQIFGVCQKCARPPKPSPRTARARSGTAASGPRR
jgi:Fur family ferric uptake transcriptional regulator